MVKSREMMWDEEFFRFLTIKDKVSNVENCFVESFYKDVPLKDVLAWTKRFVRGRKASAVHLYLNVPFCASSCAYCHCSKDLLVRPGQWRDYDLYVRAQVRQFSPLFRGVPMASLFWGGGTPSLLPERQLEGLMDLLRRRFALAKGAQVSVEVHPASLTLSKLKLLKKYGVNRISLGVQSFDVVLTAAVGRCQTSAQVARAVGMIQEVGFEAFNIDLMAGLPGQTLMSFMGSLRKAVAIAPTSIQLNPFCDIQNSLYFKQHPAMSLAKLFRDRASMLGQARHFLSQSGYEGVACGFFHRQGTAHLFHAQLAGMSREAHSLLGLGPYARTRLTGGGAFTSRVAQDDPARPVYRGMRVGVRFHMAEFLLEHLWHGLRVDEFRRVFGRDLGRVFQREIGVLERKGVLARQGDRIFYQGSRDMEGAFDYFAAMKVFYESKFLLALRDRYDHVYRPGLGYAFGPEAFLSKMQDTVFMMRVGVEADQRLRPESE